MAPGSKRNQAPADLKASAVAPEAKTDRGAWVGPTIAPPARRTISSAPPPHGGATTSIGASSDIGAPIAIPTNCRPKQALSPRTKREDVCITFMTLGYGATGLGQYRLPNASSQTSKRGTHPIRKVVYLRGFGKNKLCVWPKLFWCRDKMAINCTKENVASHGFAGCYHR